MEKITYNYTKRDVETLMNLCMAYRRKSKIYTYFTAFVCLLIILISMSDNSHLSWLMLCVVILINAFYLFKINKCRRAPYKGIALAEKGVVTSKYYRGDALVIDKSSYIPVLGDLFPKRWGKKMVVVPHYYVEVSDDSYIVDEATYNRIEKEDEVQLIFAPTDKLFLDMKLLSENKDNSVE